LAAARIASCNQKLAVKYRRQRERRKKGNKNVHSITTDILKIRIL
jgi:hypothetical protein